MTSHPLKIVSLIAITALIICQISLLFWLQHESRYIISGILTLPLLFPLKGLISSNRYTFKWTGFVTLIYFSIGVSETFANPDLRLYGTLNLLFSCILFISSIYYSRYLRQIQASS